MEFFKKYLVNFLLALVSAGIAFGLCECLLRQTSLAERLGWQGYTALDTRLHGVHVNQRFPLYPFIRSVWPTDAGREAVFEPFWDQKDMRDW